MVVIVVYETSKVNNIWVMKFAKESKESDVMLKRKEDEVLR